MTTIHPDVKNALLYADTVHDHLLGYIDKMQSLTAERLSEDKEIAVKVDMNGQLIDLWLKPGALERKRPADIAKEITRLITAAGQETASEVTALFHAAHQLPDFDEFVAEHGEPTDQARDDNAPAHTQN